MTLRSLEILSALLLVSLLAACSSGPDCRGSSVVCGGACVALASDGRNCGACGNACAAGLVCSSGACAVTCQAGLIACGGGCIDPLRDPDFCGASGACAGQSAGAVCATGERCSGGACALSCPHGELACGASCVDPLTDRLHCGASGECSGAGAGSACGDGELCASGVCALSCQRGLVDCGGTCIDPKSDRSFCGASGGCSGASAGATCADGQVCSNGACALSCPAGLVDCGGTCIDPRSDRSFCGASGSCTSADAGSVCGAGEVCASGQCALSCPPGLIVCGGSCVDPASDRTWCGASAGCSGADAGVACADGELCSSGQCALSCQQGLIECGGTCVDPQSSLAYCGASVGCSGADAGAACGSGEQCASGRCVPSCAGGQIACGGGCVDPESDPSFCGASGACTGPSAGSVCASGQACVGGSCRALCEGTALDLATPFANTGFTRFATAAQPAGYQPSAFWNGQPRPRPTNMWWQNLVLGAGQDRIDAVPYQLHALPNQLSIALAAPVDATDEYGVGDLAVPEAQQLAFSSTGVFTGPKVTAYDRFSVTLVYSTGSNTMTLPLVLGMPYVTADYAGLTPKLLPGTLSFSKVNGSSSGAATATRFAISMSDGSSWLLYASAPIALSWSSGAITAGAPFTGALRLANLPAQAGAAAVLDAHAGAIPRGASFSVSTGCGAAALAFNFASTGSGPLLMMAMPHHLAHLVAPVEPGLSYNSLSGALQAIEGSTWTQQIALPAIDWNAPRPIAAADLADVQAALSADTSAAVNNATTHFLDSQAAIGTDPYFNGKVLAKLARLSLIADEIGDEADGATLRAILEPLSAAWLDGTNSDKLLYDSTWGGLISTNGLASPGADYGQGHYNDHHFHYGYHLYAAAVLTKANPAFAVLHKEGLLGLARDIANPSSADPYFPQLRMFDLFRGHAWASGLEDSARGVDQESTSEAVNAWYGLRLLGLALGDQQMANLGSLLLAMEIDAAQTYWHVPLSSPLYDAGFRQNRGVGRLFAFQATFSTWFGKNPEYVYGIQMLPYTPVSELLVAPSWIGDAWTAKLGPVAASLPDNGWKGFLYMSQATIDPASAYTTLHNLASYDDGNSRTNTLWWAASRQ